MGVRIPATGTGDTTPLVATDKIASVDYQQIKIVDGTIGGTQGAVVDSSGNLQVALKAATALLGASVSNFPAVQPVSGSVAITNFPATQSVQGLVGASIANTPTVTIASTSISVGVSVANFPTNIGSATTFLASSFPGVFVGASISNAGALSAASQVVVGGSITIASALPGIYVGASVPNFPATQQVQGLVGASVSNFPGTQPVSGNVTASVIGYVGASIANTPQISIASYSVTQPISIASTNVTQPVSGNVTASVIGYVGASVAGGTLTASTIGFVGASITNFPANQNVTITGQPVSVSGNVTASVIGYVGASISGTPSVNAFGVGGSVAVFPDAAPAAGYGASPLRYISGASVNNVLVKNAAGTLYNVTAMNVNTSPRYLRLYDKATTPSPGTDLPRQTYVIPGASAGAGAVIPMPVGTLFAAGIGFDITGGSMGDTDTTVTGLGDVVVNLGYS